MAQEQKEGHNGHRNVLTGAERVRSGFDRRKSWSDSIENVYRRIDNRLSELVQVGSSKGKELKEDAEGLVEQNPAQFLGLCFAAGLLVGLLMGRNGKSHS